METSSGRIAARDAATFCTVAALVTWLRTPDDVPQLLAADRWRRDVDGDEHRRSLAASRLDREIHGDPAVDEEPAVDLDGRQDPGERHARPDGRGEVTPPEDDAFSVRHVGGLAPERDREPVEVRDERGREEDLPENEGELLPLDEARRKSELPLVDPDDELRQVLRVVELPPEGAVDARHLVDERVVPVHRRERVLHLLRGHSGRVEAADDGPDAGPDDEVHRDVELLQHLQDADLGPAAGPAAREDEPDLRPSRLRRSGRRRDEEGREKRNRQETSDHVEPPPAVSLPRCLPPGADEISPRPYLYTRSTRSPRGEALLISRRARPTLRRGGRAMTPIMCPLIYSPRAH